MRSVELKDRSQPRTVSCIGWANFRSWPQAGASADIRAMQQVLAAQAPVLEEALQGLAHGAEGEFVPGDLMLVEQPGLE